jgi:threonine dehydrogenase-like Zn-dependent dehydrogenase
MRTAISLGERRVRVCTVPDPKVKEPTDVVVRIVASAICATDLPGYRSLNGSVRGTRCGHEFVGVVADIGDEVVSVRRGDTVVAAFPLAGGLAEGVRVPRGDVALVKVPMGERDERLPAVLTLCDAMAGGHHAVRSAGVRAGSSVAVVSDDAAGLCAVLAARAAGAGRIFLASDCVDRAAIAVKFGATDIVSPNKDRTSQQIRDLTAGAGADLVIDCALDEQAVPTTLAACRDGGMVSLGAGLHSGATGLRISRRSVRIRRGPAPARTYLPQLLAEVMTGELDPSPIFDFEVPLSLVALGYEVMHTRAAVKVLVKP